MKRLLFFLILIALVGGATYYYYSNNPYFQNKPVGQNNKISYMTIQSLAFKDSQTIPSKYTCDGENINPPLTLTNIPYGTKSLVLMVEDPDSPSKDFTHWVMFNIDPYLKEIPENFVSENVTMGKNDFGNIGYGGPCPQVGNHRYSFKLYAINTILLLQRGSTKSEILSAIKDRIIEETQTFGFYKRH